MNQPIVYRNKIYLLLFFAMIVETDSQAKSSTMRILTYNIRYENQWDTGAISWANRKTFILNSILYHKADIIGMQEVLQSQLMYFDSTLKDFSHVGVGREDGKEKGEYAPIFYNRNLYERLDDGTFWLSPTPEKVSKGWDAALERICTWVKLKEKQSGKQFFVFNTHFDHMGALAREESAKLILEKIHSLAGNFPVILTGDFNTGENSIPILTITEKEKQDHLLFDAMFISKLPHLGSIKTFCGFNVKDGIIGDRIDYIFVSKQISVLSHATFTDFTGEHFPSDHFPVMSELVLNENN